MKSIYSFLIVACISISGLHAQVNFKNLFPDLQGRALFDAVVSEYKTGRVLGYKDARDTLFAIIDNQDGFLECVYSGYIIELDPNEDPTSDAYKKKINTEHIYPQNKGAKRGKAKSDMHHLYPVRITVNSSRGNLPFAEIQDSKVTKWFVNDQTLREKPKQEIELYSEWNNRFFEPKETFKGNLARSVFYFYTMYEQQALNADSVFFSNMLKDMCMWHENDPVDEREWERNIGIASYQDNKLNPFIIDPALANRMFCNPAKETLPLPIRIAPSPTPYLIEWHKEGEQIVVDFLLQRPYTFELIAYDEKGKQLTQFYKEDHKPGIFSTSINVKNLPAKAYLYAILRNKKQSFNELLIKP